MTKAVAYYRSRPSEPEASDLALRLQREAVRKALEEVSGAAAPHFPGVADYAALR